MRRGSGRSWLMNGEEELVGVNLGADYVAEHEWGVKQLQEYLGISQTKVHGIEARRCHPDPEHILLKKEGDKLSLMIHSKHQIEYYKENPLDDKRYASDWTFYQDDDFVTAWDQGSCVIRVKGKENCKRLREIHQQLLEGNCAVWLGGGGVFKNAGLCFAIISKIPQENLKEMYDADVDRDNLQKAAEATGIKKKIDEANESNPQIRYYPKLGYYALSPRWVFESEKSKTKHPVIFWLNPMRQQEHNFGWFTVEELEEWLTETGPIPIKEKND